MAAGARLTFPLTGLILLLVGASAPPPTGDPKTDLPPDEYYEGEYEDKDLSATKASVPPVNIRCQYDPCAEEQLPCLELSRASGCSCPGSTLQRELPLAPGLKSVAWNGSQVVARWCAPYSYVTGFYVEVGGEQRRRFDGGRRSGALGDIEHITKVCVVAVNDAGDSGPSCLTYRPRDANLPLKVGFGVGAAALLLLLLLAVLLWRRRKQNKQEAGVATK